MLYWVTHYKVFIPQTPNHSLLTWSLLLTADWLFTHLQKHKRIRGGTLTNELKNLLKVLSKVLLAVISGWQPFVAQSRVDVVEGQVCGHVDHIADVEAQQQVQVLGISLIPQKQEGQDGADHGILRIWSHHTFIRQRSRQWRGERQREVPWMKTRRRESTYRQCLPCVKTLSAATEKEMTRILF